MSNFNKVDFKNKRTIVRDEKYCQRPIYLFKNQRMCITKKPNWLKTGWNFTQIGSEEWHHAFRNLSKSAFGLWLYSMENQNNFGFSLVPNYVCKHLGFKSEKTYHNAKKELIEKGWWIDMSNENDDYKETICLAFPEMDTEWSDSTWHPDYEHTEEIDANLYDWMGEIYDDDYGNFNTREAWERSY